jgi:uncharacterized phage protein (TIGR02218 family)
VRIVPALLQAHLDQPDTTTTRLLKIMLRTGLTYGLTTLDRTVTYDDGDGSIDYIATNGFDAATFSTDSGLSVSNAEAFALISDVVPGVTVEMVEAGDFDDARWICYLVNFEDLSMGHVILDAGDLGEVRTKHGMIWIPELLSYAMRLRQTVGSVWSRKCRAIFGSNPNSQTGCGVNLAPLWVSGSVTVVGSENNRTFTASAVLGTPPIVPAPGRVQWLTGANAGREFPVEEVVASVVELTETTAYPIQVGDTYRIRPDCMKRFLEDCIQTWDNGINFKGEPHIPVGDASQIQTPGAQAPGGGGFSGEQPVTPPPGAPPQPEPPPNPAPNPPPPPSDYWPNWPMMVATCVQGPINNTILNSTRHQEFADKDLVIFQSTYMTEIRAETRTNAMDQINAINPGTKFFVYTIANETYKTMPSSTGQNEREITKALVDHPTKGNPNWYVHRVGQPGASGRVEPTFSPSTLNQLNMAALVAGNNSLGENYATAYWKEHDGFWSLGTPPFKTKLRGFFVDAFCAKPPPMYVNNGSTTITDHDFNANGVSDTIDDFSGGPNAGGRFWAEGHLEFKTRMEARFPGFVLIPNAARWSYDYFDGRGQAPLPLSTHPFYQQWELTLQESWNNWLGLRRTSSGYTFTGGGSVQSACRAYEIQERMLMADVDSDNVGICAVLLHTLMCDRAPIANDHRWARFFTALCMMVERAAPCVQRNGDDPYSLDESCLQLGNPIAPRTMGTLNESTLAFTLRAADQSVGVARFYWARFDNAIVVTRCDSPSIGNYPSSDAKVLCTLPAPPGGFKWQMSNAATYVNPITGRAMRGQDVTFNTGADVTQVLLGPYEAAFVRLVPV